MSQKAMQKWDEQQRLKRMSKKIAEAKSILKKEKIIGPGAPAGAQRKVCKTPMSADSDLSERSSVGGAYAAYATPYGGGKAAVQRKTRQKPAWDSGHVDYTVQTCYPVRQYTPQKRVREPVMHRALARPAPVKVPNTRKGVKKAIIKGLDKIEAIAKQATGSPKKSHRDVAKDLEELHALRENLCGQKPEEAAGGAGGGDEASDRDLRQSIRDLSSLLDTKLSKLMEETECEVNLGSPQRTHRARHLDDDDEVEMGIEGEGAERAAEGQGGGEDGAMEGGGEEEGGMGGWQAGEEMERDDERDEDGDDGDGYADDDFDDDEAAASGEDDQGGGGGHVSQEVMDELMEAQAKIHKLALMVTPEASLHSPNKSPKKSASSSQPSSSNQTNPTSPYLSAGAEHSEGSGSAAGVHDGTGAESGGNAAQGGGGGDGQGVAGEAAAMVGDGLAAPGAPPAAAPPLKSISSKPFSFKMKLGGGGGGGGSQKQLEINSSNQPLFASGFTTLNSETSSVKQRIALQEQQHQALHHKPHAGSLGANAGVEDTKTGIVAARAGGSASSSQDRGGVIMSNVPQGGGGGGNGDGCSHEPPGETCVPASIAEAGRSESGIVCDGVAAISVSAAPADGNARAGSPAETGSGTAAAVDARPRRGARSMLGLLGTPAPATQAAESSPPANVAPGRLGSASGRGSRPLLSHVSSAAEQPSTNNGATGTGARSSSQGGSAQPPAATGGKGVGVYSGFSINNPTSHAHNAGASSSPTAGDVHASISPNAEGRSRPPTQGGDVGEAPLSGADTERKGGRKRINAADIKRAMLAGKAASPDGSHGGAVDDGKPNTTLDVGAVHAGYEPSGMSDRSSARSARGPFRAHAQARFSAAGSLLEQAKEEDSRQPSAVAPSRQMGGGWAQSLGGDDVDVEGSLDVEAL